MYLQLTLHQLDVSEVMQLSFLGGVAVEERDWVSLYSSAQHEPLFVNQAVLKLTEMSASRMLGLKRRVCVCVGGLPWALF